MRLAAAVVPIPGNLIEWSVSLPHTPGSRRILPLGFGGQPPPVQPQNAVAAFQLTFTMGMSWLLQPSLKLVLSASAPLCSRQTSCTPPRLLPSDPSRNPS